MSTRLHATCVAIDAAGVLLLGPSGSGKSDLALRLIDGGAKLVADDQVALEVRDGRLMASAPSRLPPLLELRGVGLVPMERAALVPLAAAFELRPHAGLERLPDPKVWGHGGVAVPLYWVDPAMPSAAARVRLLARRTPVSLDLPVDDA